MTLYQMSFVYREDALRFRMRITVLREQAKAAPTKEELLLTEIRDLLKAQKGTAVKDE